jgi:hypothetical protein
MTAASDSNSSRRRDSYAVVAFWLAFLIMIAPTQAGLLAGFVAQKRFDLAAVLALGCFAIVAIPYVRSFQRHRREPQVWSGRGHLIATSVILILNLLVLCTVLIRAI